MSEKRKNEKGRQKNKAEKEENNEKKILQMGKGIIGLIIGKGTYMKEVGERGNYKKRDVIRKMKRLYERG